MRWEYTDLLDAAGINAVSVLANYTAENLLDKLSLINIQKKLVRQLPTLNELNIWIEQAKTLSPVIID
jgi:hypothetical protein